MLLLILKGYSYGSKANSYYDVNPTLLQYKNIWPKDLSVEKQTVFENVFIDHSNVAKGIITALQLLEDNNNNNNNNNKMDYLNITQNGEDISIMRLFHYFPFSSKSSEIENEMICSSPHTGNYHHHHHHHHHHCHHHHRLGFFNSYFTRQCRWTSILI